MKHNALTALSMAAALVVAGSAGATEFEVTFEGYTVDESPIGQTQTDGAWSNASASDDFSVITNLTRGTSTKSLALDTGDTELIFTPTSTEVSILTMDVFFVGTDTPPTLEAPFTAKTALYLDTSVEGSAVLKATTDGTTWTNLTASVTEGTWYQVQMKFDGTEVEYFVNGTSAGKATLGATFTKVNSVGFKGTGMVDNFVGDKAGIPGATDDGTGETAGNSASYNSTTGVVTGDFSTTDLKFIRVFDSSDNYVTLRYTDSQSITLPTGFTPAKVVAYYGDTVTATTGVTPSAETVTVDDSGDITKISITVPGACVKSGLYYTPVAPGGRALAASQLVAPEDDGEGLSFSVDAATTDWGVVKFNIVASDDPITNNN